MLRNPNSISDSDTIVQDPVLEPFFITRSSNGGYAVYERVTTGENNTEYIKTLGYPSTFGNAIQMIAREMLNEEGKTYDLKSYINRWEEIKNSISSIIE